MGREFIWKICAINYYLRPKHTKKEELQKKKKKKKKKKEIIIGCMCRGYQYSQHWWKRNAAKITPLGKLLLLQRKLIDNMFVNI